MTKMLISAKRLQRTDCGTFPVTDPEEQTLETRIQALERALQIASDGVRIETADGTIVFDSLRFEARNILAHEHVTSNGLEKALPSGQVIIVAQYDMDDGGRLNQAIEPETLDPVTRCEMIFETGAYWRSRGHGGARVIDEIILRFTIDDPHGAYHMPIIVSPYGYSTWKSG